jgi:hypothetical protein
VSVPALHVGAPQPPRGSVPAAMGAQSPLGCPVSAARHATQLPAHADAQQTPSAHTPLAHSFAAAHAALVSFRATHAPDAQ